MGSRRSYSTAVRSSCLGRRSPRPPGSTARVGRTGQPAGCLKFSVRLATNTPQTGVWPGSCHPPGLRTCAMLVRQVAEFTRPAYSSTSLGLLPPVSTRVGLAMNVGTVFLPGWIHPGRKTVPTFIAKPTRVETGGNRPKLVDEYAGRVNSATCRTSIAHVRSPGGWQEPGQTPVCGVFVASRTENFKHPAGWPVRPILAVKPGGRGERRPKQLDRTAVEEGRRLPMSQVTFSIPDEILIALKATPEVLASRIRLAAAVKLYEMGQLSSGAAAQLAGVPKPYFLGHLADYGVNTFDLTEEELIHDLKSA